MSAIYAIIDAAHVDDLNAAFVAMQCGPGVFATELTDDVSPSETSTVTHFHMYNAAANPRDYSDYAAAKAGSVAPPDINGDPVAWGVDGNISEAAALAAFSALQIWANDSDRSASEFAAEQRQGLGLSIKPTPS